MQPDYGKQMHVNGSSCSSSYIPSCSPLMQLRYECLQAIVVAVSTTTVPPAAAAQGMSSTAQYDFNDPSSVYLAVTFATYPQAFNSLQLDSLMTDPNRLCSGYTVGPLTELSCSCSAERAPMAALQQLHHQPSARSVAS